MNAPVSIKGWCPSALRPMMSGDGLLVRVRISDATLAPDDALALAVLAKDFGNGLIDLTRRGNLQLRGVREADWPTLIDALRARGLVSDAEQAGQVVNIQGSPLAGFDPAMAFDPRVMAQGIESGLLADHAFRALPSKFGFAIDGGGMMPLGETDADIRIVPGSDSSHLTIGIAGAPNVAIIAPHDAAAAALALTRAFLTLRNDERRLHAVVERVGNQPVFAAAGLHAAERTGWSSESAHHALGTFACGSTNVLGVAAPFGAWTADDFAAVATAAPDASLRVTPWRALLVVGLASKNAAASAAAFAARGLIVSPDDPLLNVMACSGAPACTSATVATRALASNLAQAAITGSGRTLHVSGCAKGCAHPHTADIALVGHAGRYDLVENGMAGDMPVLTGLDANDVVRAVVGRALS